MGNHDGNRFTITVRGCADENGNPLESKEAMSRVLSIRESMNDLLGIDAFQLDRPQRFGSTRPVTPEVGRGVVESDFESCVHIHRHERDEIGGRRRVQKVVERDKRCLCMPGDYTQAPWFERSMLKGWKNPDDYLGAFKSLPQSLQILMVHSLQSLAFNHT